MINFDNYTNENKVQDNPKWPYIPDHPYKVLIMRGSGSGKANALLNLISLILIYAKEKWRKISIFD